MNTSLFHKDFSHFFVLGTFPEYKESNSTDEELDEGEMYSDFIAEPSNEVEIQSK